MAFRFRSILHRVISKGSMDDDVLNPKDDSRPAFARAPCCMGIYLDAIDARPDKTVTVGSHHAFMMAVMDKMLDYLQTLDLAKVKGAMETRHICDGVVVEGFRSGCVLAVTFDSLDSVESLWTLHAKNRLTSLCQDMFVDRALLKATNTVKISLRVKLWDDEYKNCKQEMTARSPSRLKLADFKSDLSMVHRVKEHQKSMPELIGKSRDAESKFEHSLGEFMLTIKRALPQTTSTIPNVKEFSTNIKMARGVKQSGFETIDHFLQTLEFFKKVFTDIEQNIVHPLCQVRALCENEKQRNLKKAIKDACAEILTILKPEMDLQKVRHKDWELKVLQRERGLFYGLISLIPLSLDRLTSIDVNVDEYVMDFAEMASQ